MSTLFRCLTCCLAAVGLASWSQAQRPADTILVNGNVITVDDAQPRARAIAIADGRILAVGTDAEVRAHETAATRVIDLGGRTVVPGLADNHFHSAGGGAGVDLSGARTLAEVLSAIAAAVREAAPGAVVVTNSDWHEAQLAEQRLPLRRDLDAVAPDHPVVVVRGGHEYVLNSAGLARWGITVDTPVPAGGEISRYDDGSLNGELIDAAKNLVSLDPPPPRDVETRIADRLAEHARLHAAGLTSIRHPGGAPDQYELLAELKRRGELRIRVNFLFRARGARTAEELGALVDAWPATQDEGDEWLRVGGVKLGVDGGFEGGWMREPYAEPFGRGGTFHGLQTMPADRFTMAVSELNRRGWRVATHAVGDAAIDQGDLHVGAVMIGIAAWLVVPIGSAPKRRWHAQVPGIVAALPTADSPCKRSMRPRSATPCLRGVDCYHGRRWRAKDQTASRRASEWRAPMNRRDFIRTSVGAGLLVSAYPRSLFARFQAQERRGTMFDKIWDAHVVASLGGETDLLQVDRCIGGSPTQVMRLVQEGVELRNPDIFYNVPDHTVSTSPDRYNDRSLGWGWQPYEELAREMTDLGFTKAFGQFDPRFGIMHVVGPETGLSQPGMVLCAGDSHTCTHGAMGLISWGGENSDNILRTGTVIRRRPRTMRVHIVGTLGPGIGAKDVILRTIARLGTDSGTGYAVEYAGPVVRALSQEARFSICNLAVEMASPTGMVSPDDTTYEYLAGREFAPSARYWDQALALWRTLPTDDDAVFHREETIDMTGVEPQVTWGINPEHAIGISERIPDPDQAPANKRATYRQAIEYSRLTPGEPILGTPIDEVFIGSCVESRISDLRAAAAIVEGRRVASTITSAWVVPGSNAVKAQAEAEGLDRIFKDAGFEWRESGCSKCYGSNGDYVEPGHRCVSNSNRNYIGRQGRDTNTILASTTTVAASAIAGSVSRA